MNHFFRRWIAGSYLLAVTVFLGTIFPCDATCIPDDAQYSPTPTLSWAPVTANPHLMGYRIYWRVPPNILWTLGAVVPCRHDVDEVTGLDIHETHICQGEMLPGQAFADVFAYPVQRLGDWELTTLEFAATAYNALGESLALSAPLSVCMSPLCHLDGTPCQ